jgi:hypothetical protein
MKIIEAQIQDFKVMEKRRNRRFGRCRLFSINAGVAEVLEVVWC